jgi:molecular chaperone GrpE
MDDANDQMKREEAANDPGEEAVAAPEGSEGAAPAEDAVAALEAELAATKDRLLRALAETENVRRRAEREREDMRKYAISGFAKDLLSAADNLRRALDSMPLSEIREERVKSLIDGVEATERELLAAFERHGIRRIDPKGESFDHNFHQAIFETETADAPAGTVVEVLQPGYVIHGRLLRPAMVGVAKEAPHKGRSRHGPDAAG